MNAFDSLDIEDLSQLHSDKKGLIGEYYVAAYLTALGYEVFHVPTKGFDLLVVPYGDEGVGKVPIRVDVKTSIRDAQTNSFHIKKTGTLANQRISNPFDSAVCDVLALFCLETRRLNFINSQLVHGLKAISLSKYLPHGINPKESWEQAQKNPQLSLQFDVIP